MIGTPVAGVDATAIGGTPSDRIGSGTIDDGAPAICTLALDNGVVSGALGREKPGCADDVPAATATGATATGAIETGPISCDATGSADRGATPESSRIGEVAATCTGAVVGTGESVDPPSPGAGVSLCCASA